MRRAGAVVALLAALGAAGCGGSGHAGRPSPAVSATHTGPPQISWRALVNQVCNDYAYAQDHHYSNDQTARLVVNEIRAARAGVSVATAAREGLQIIKRDCIP